MMVFETLSGYNSSMISACGNFSYDTSTIHVALTDINQTLTNLECFDMCRSKAVLDFHQPFMQMLIIIVILCLFQVMVSIMSPKYARIVCITINTLILVYILVMIL